MHHYRQYLVNPWKLIRVLGALGYMNWIPDRLFLQLMYRAEFGIKLDLDNPKRFNEKIQWLKLYDRRPIYSDLVDKYKVRNYVKEKIGSEYLVPLLGVWENPEEIAFDSLPEKFVLKCNHDSGTVVICKDKSKLDIHKTVEYLKKRCSNNFYWGGREWPYKNVKPKVICEQYLENTDMHGLIDYKIYCFDGNPKLMMIATDRFTGKETHFDFFDQDFKWLDLEWEVHRSEVPPKKPNRFDEMMKIAKKLSVDIPQVRVDLYEVNDKIYFGEMTFYDGSGMQKITPDKWDYILGSWINLPQKESKKCAY